MNIKEPQKTLRNLKEAQGTSSDFKASKET